MNLPEGYTVKYQHLRRRPGSLWLKSAYELRSQGEEIDCKGGVTRCSIYDDDGNLLVHTIAICNPADNYNKAIGRAISYGRALKVLQSASQ